jgi:NitT/TauT family transport system substrate-binding protein
VAVWHGHELSLFATLDKNGIEPREITLVLQPLGMDFFVKRQVDSAAAMTYNELRQVQDAGVSPDQVVVIDFNKEGTATLKRHAVLKRPADTAAYTDAEWQEAQRRR